MSQFLFRNLNPQFVEFRRDIKYKTQVGLCVGLGLKKRGYTRAEDWDLYWLEKQALDSFYVNNRVRKDQRINHFRTYFEICRKDNLNRNLKKYRRNLEREGNLKESASYNFMPLTFHLPLEYSLFADEFKKLALSQKHNVWIMKPTSKSQGKGIFLFNRLVQIQDWAENLDTEAYICQKYIENPLLIGHKKSDLRLYVLCTSYRPLNIYLYRQGFARFTHFRYDETNIFSNQIHLTNVAIQKHTSQYSHHLGGKWLLSKLKLYLLSKYEQQLVFNCFNEIKSLVIKTLKSVSKIMSNEPNCFELYGFDVMIDDKLKPWLIQINGSPSMRANTEKDQQLKIGIIDDMLSVIDLQKILSGNEEKLGGFDLIYKKDELFEPEYFKDAKVPLLGCILQRQKAYCKLAISLNAFHKANLNRQSPQKKGFSVRRQKFNTSRKPEKGKSQKIITEMSKSIMPQSFSPTPKMMQNHQKIWNKNSQPVNIFSNSSNRTSFTLTKHSHLN